MRAIDVFTYGAGGFMLGFYGTSASRAIGVKAESDLINAIPLLTSIVIGAVALPRGQAGMTGIMLYAISLVAGGIAGAVAFDSVNPNYQPPTFKR